MEKVLYLSGRLEMEEQLMTVVAVMDTSFPHTPLELGQLLRRERSLGMLRSVLHK